MTTKLDKKSCSKCGKRKPITRFYTAGKRKDGTVRHQSHCKDCQIAYQRSRYNRLYKTDPVFRNYFRVSHYRQKYNLTLEELQRIEKKQKGRCAVCGFKPNPEARSRAERVLEVDHDHRTGKVRGLLCRRCNDALGKLEDSPKLVFRLHAYLVQAA